MKKLTLFLMAIFTAIAANAWTVKFTNPGNWAKVCVYTFSPETEGTWPGKEMIKSGDVWEYTGTGTPSKIIFNNGGNGSQTGDLDFVDGATYNLQGPEGAQTHDYTVYFDNSVSNWANVYAYCYNGITTAAWPGDKLSANAEGLYEFTWTATSEPQNAVIIFNNGTGNVVGTDQTDNLDFVPGTTYNVNGSVGDDPVPPTPGGDYKGWYVNIGSADITGYWKGVAVPESGVVTLTDLTIGTNEFKVKVYDGASDAYYTSSTKTIETGVATALVASTENDCPMTITDAAEGDIYSVSYDCATNTITLTKSGNNPDPVVSIPDALYLIGNINGLTWDTAEAVEMTRKDNTYSVLATINNTGEGFGYFSFCTVKGDDWNAVNGGDRFGAPEEDAEITIGTATDYMEYPANVSASACKSWKAPKGTYNFVVDFENGTVRLDVPSGIENVEAAEDTEVVYFNLQGVRVDNPANGVFVRVANGKATKVIK